MTAIMPPFAASRLRVMRAKQHQTELLERLTEFTNDSPFGIYIDQAPNKKPTMHFGMVAFVPPILSLCLGDVVHSLRAALDLLACDAVTNAGGSARSARFPFARESVGLGRAINESGLKKAGKEVCDLVRSLQPYRGGNDRLAALHALDIMDKHHELLAGYPAIDVPAMDVVWPNGQRATLRDCHFGVDNEVELQAIPRAVQLLAPAGLTLHLNNDAPEFTQRTPILDLLEDMIQMTSGVIEAFETLVLGQTGEWPRMGKVTLDAPLFPRPQVFFRDLSTLRMCHLSHLYGDPRGGWWRFERGIEGHDPKLY